MAKKTSSVRTLQVYPHGQEGPLVYDIVYLCVVFLYTEMVKCALLHKTNQTIEYTRYKMYMFFS